MNIGASHRRAWQVAAVVVVLAAGAAAGWIVGGGGGSAQASEKVRFLPAAAVQSGPFTPPADVRGKITINGSGPYGGSGSNFVCDRELLIKHLLARPERLRAWAEVEGIKPTAAAVTRYIRSLTPATLLTATRVTNHSYVDGKAKPFESLLGGGTAVLVDELGSVRVRCRCGNPLLDPQVSDNEQCVGCTAGVELPDSWRLASTYYAVHPAPPPVEGAKWTVAEPKDPITLEVVGALPGQYVVEETDANGEQRQRTVGAPGPTPTPETRTVTAKPRTHTVTVPRVTTVTRQVVVTVPQTVTQIRTITVFRGEG